MALNIKSAEADRLARLLAARTGETITEAVTLALAERLERQGRRSAPSRLEFLQELRGRVSAMPVLDPRPDDELLGYTDEGLFE